MIKIYANGNDFLKENDEYLSLNEHIAVFFRLDGPLMDKCDNQNYCLRVTEDDHVLLALEFQPFNLLLFGDWQCAEELFRFLTDNGYQFRGLLCTTELGEKCCELLKDRHDMNYALSIGMDFMEADEITSPSCDDVTIPGEEHVDQLCNHLRQFFLDCHLEDTVDPGSVRKTLSQFRCLISDGNIISMAKITPATESEDKIACVYTPAQFRGRGLARKVVSTAKNEIISAGRKATLNVDQNNPISYHLYSSLGFRKVFSQGIYLPEQ